MVETLNPNFGVEKLIHLIYFKEFYTFKVYESKLGGSLAVKIQVYKLNCNSKMNKGQKLVQKLGCTTGMYLTYVLFFYF